MVQHGLDRDRGECLLERLNTQDQTNGVGLVRAGVAVHVHDHVVSTVSPELAREANIQVVARDQHMLGHDPLDQLVELVQETRTEKVRGMLLYERHTILPYNATKISFCNVRSLQAKFAVRSYFERCGAA